jgi:hypothetical protein
MMPAVVLQVLKKTDSESLNSVIPVYSGRSGAHARNAEVFSV